MRKMICLLLGVFLFIPTNQALIRKVKLIFVDFGIETPIRIGKNEFESSFANEIDSTFIVSQNRIKILRKLILSLPRADVNLYPRPDVRLKIILSGSNSISDTICVGQFVAEKDNNLFIVTPDFMKFIKHICRK